MSQIFANLLIWRSPWLNAHREVASSQVDLNYCISDIRASLLFFWRYFWFDSPRYCQVAHGDWSFDRMNSQKVSRRENEMCCDHRLTSWSNHISISHWRNKMQLKVQGLKQKILMETALIGRGNNLVRNDKLRPFWSYADVEEIGTRYNFQCLLIGNMTWVVPISWKFESHII
jgi:hypothetical protein